MLNATVQTRRPIGSLLDGAPNDELIAANSQVRKGACPRERQRRDWLLHFSVTGPPIEPWDFHN